MKFNLNRLTLFLIFTAGLINAQELPEREIHYRPGDWISYPVTRYITSISLGHQYTYFGTTAGIIRYDFYRYIWDHPFTVSNGLENDRIRAVTYDFATGYVWCATEAGLSFRIPSSEEWLNISYQSLGISSVSSIGTGKKYLWLNSSEGLLRGERTSGDFRNVGLNEEKEDEVQWNSNIAGNNNKYTHNLFMESGYFFFPEGYIQDIELRKFNIVETFRDKFDNLWMATWGLGAGVADMKLFTLDLLPFSLYSPEVDAMAWDESGMWIGGRHHPEVPGGITWWDMDRGEWVYFEAEFISRLRSDEVTSIATDTTFVWFGTKDGLARYNKEKDAWRVFSVHTNLWADSVTSVVLGNGVLWVGTSMGINRILLPGMIVEKIRNNPLIHREIYQLEIDGADVWAGTDLGIYRYNAEQEKWEYVPGYPGMVTKIVRAISAWENEVWFGTDDGIEYYNKKKNEWQGFPVQHYPIEGTINTILADSDAVWIGTEDGVLKYKKSEDRWRRFTIEDGLLDNSVRWILLDGDYVWFGTGRGLTRFYWNAPYRID